MKAYALITLLLISNLISAQDVTETLLPWKSGQKVVLNLKFGKKIKVEAWDKQQVSIISDITINGGTLNNAHDMDTLISDERIEIVTDFDKDIIPKKYWR